MDGMFPLNPDTVTKLLEYPTLMALLWVCWLQHKTIVRLIETLNSKLNGEDDD